VLKLLQAGSARHRLSGSVPQRAELRNRLELLISAVLLVGTVGISLVHDRGLVATFGMVAAACALLALVVLAGGRRPPSPEPEPRRLPVSVELLLHLSPVLLLSLAFPVVSERIAAVQIGGASLTGVVLGSSLTVPWLSQSVCMPLYRGVGPQIEAGDRAALRSRFCAVWPLIALRALPVVAVFALPVQLVMGWSLPALAAYLALSILHLVFAQLLVLTNAPGQRPLWALAWAGYAGALLVAPTVWFLPVVVGILIQLVPLRRHLRELARPVHLDRRDVVGDLLGGLLVGSVLWADKLLFFLTAGRDFAVNTVFLALLPAILAYNLYFVLLAPRFDRSVRALRTAMEEEPLDRLHVHSRALSGVVGGSLVRIGLAGAAMAFLVTCLVATLAPGSAALSAAVSVASWMFMMTTVVCYKLEYIGQRRPAQLGSAAHLAFTIGTFTVLDGAVQIYLTLAALELVVLMAALRSCLRHWRVPEYTLFWRHATSW